MHTRVVGTASDTASLSPSGLSVWFTRDAPVGAAVVLSLNIGTVAKSSSFGLTPGTAVLCRRPRRRDVVRCACSRVGDRGLAAFVTDVCAPCTRSRGRVSRGTGRSFQALFFLHARHGVVLSLEQTDNYHAVGSKKHLRTDSSTPDSARSCTTVASVWMEPERYQSLTKGIEYTTKLQT